MTSEVRSGIARPQPGECARALEEESGPCPPAPQLWTWVCPEGEHSEPSSLFCRVEGEQGWTACVLKFLFTLIFCESDSALVTSSG